MAIKRMHLWRKNLIVRLAVLENLDFQRSTWSISDTKCHVEVLWTWIQADEMRWSPDEYKPDASVATLDLSLPACIEFLWHSIYRELERWTGCYRPARTGAFEDIIEVEIVHYLMKTLDTLIAEIAGWQIEHYLNHPLWSDILKLATLALDEFSPRRLSLPGSMTTYECDCLYKIFEARKWVQEQIENCNALPLITQNSETGL